MQSQFFLSTKAKIFLNLFVPNASRLCTLKTSENRKVILKLFCLKLGAYSIAKFIYFNKKKFWLAPFLRVEDYGVNSPGASSCNWSFLEKLCRWQCQQIVIMQIMQILRFCCNYALEIPAVLIQVTVSAANIWVTIFIVTMQAGVFCNYGDGIFCNAWCTWLFL